MNEETDPFAPQPLARWYWLAAVAGLLFALLFCAGLVMHLTSDPTSLQLDQRVLYESQPTWVFFASALAGLATLVGASLLLARRNAAVGVLLVALVAALAWLGGVAVSPMMGLLTQTDGALLIAILTVIWTMFWFARHSRQRRWLR